MSGFFIFLKSGYDFNLIISDGSKKKINDKLLKKLKILNKLNISSFNLIYLTKFIFKKLLKP